MARTKQMARKSQGKPPSKQLQSAAVAGAADSGAADSGAADSGDTVGGAADALTTVDDLGLGDDTTMATDGGSATSVDGGYVSFIHLILLRIRTMHTTSHICQNNFANLSKWNACVFEKNT